MVMYMCIYIYTYVIMYNYDQLFDEIHNHWIDKRICTIDFNKHHIEL